METPEKIDDSRYLLRYAVEDPEGDIIQLQAQFSTDDGNTWDLMHLGGSSLEIEPWFYGEPVVWNAVRDLGHVDVDNVQIRIRAADADPGPWYFIHGLRIDTNRLPSAQIIAPWTSAGQGQLGVRLSDPDQNLLDVAYQYSPDGGTSWFPATVIEAEEAGTARYEYEIIWSRTPIFPASTAPGKNASPAIGQKHRHSGSISPFHLDNNSPPTVRIESPSRYDVFRGVVPVRFALSDRENDDIKLNLEYRIHGAEETWHIARGLMSRGPLRTFQIQFLGYLEQHRGPPGRFRSGCGDTPGGHRQRFGPVRCGNSHNP